MENDEFHNLHSASGRNHIFEGEPITVEDCQLRGEHDEHLIPLSRILSFQLPGWKPTFALNGTRQINSLQKQS